MPPVRRTAGWPRWCARHCRSERRRGNEVNFQHAEKGAQGIIVSARTRVRAHPGAFTRLDVHHASRHALDDARVRAAEESMARAEARAVSSPRRSGRARFIPSLPSRAPGDHHPTDLHPLRITSAAARLSVHAAPIGAEQTDAEFHGAGPETAKIMARVARGHIEKGDTTIRSGPCRAPSCRRRRRRHVKHWKETRPRPSPSQ